MLSTELSPRVYRPISHIVRAGFATARPRASRSRLPPNAGRPARKWVTPPKKPPQEEEPRKETIADALRSTKAKENTLLSPVHIPEDPNGVLNEKHPAISILANSAIVVQRQLELMNVLVGFEQANRYLILDPQGNHIGFIVEQDNSLGRSIARQMFNTHRSFTTHVFDKHEREVLRFHRPFSWISSRIGVYDPTNTAGSSNLSSKSMISPASGSLSTQVNQQATQISSLALSEMRIIGEAQQYWAPLRRKYNLFLSHQALNTNTNMNTRQILAGGTALSSSQQLQVSQENFAGHFTQFAYVDEPPLSWDFSLLSAGGHLIGSVNRNWGGMGREIFTDTGVYALRMDAAGLAQEPRHLISRTGETGVVAYNEERTGMTLDQRAVMLATAVSVDFDYFSRHSGAGGGMGWMPLWFPWGGEAAATGEAAEGAGAMTEAGEGSIIRQAQEGPTANIGTAAATMAGADAMGRYGSGQPAIERDNPSSTGGQEQEDFWGENADPWGGQRESRGDSSGSTDSGDSSGGEAGDFFGDIF